MSKKRHPLEKSDFFQGTRNRFGLIFLLSMFVIMGFQCYTHNDPAPYLQYLTVLCGILIGGLSGSAIVQAYKVSSLTENKNESIEQNITEKREEIESIHSIEEKMLTLTRVDPKDIDPEAFEE
jgi:hypothetical protein